MVQASDATRRSVKLVRRLLILGPSTKPVADVILSRQGQREFSVARKIGCSPRQELGSSCLHDDKARARASTQFTPAYRLITSLSEKRRNQALSATDCACIRRVRREKHGTRGCYCPRTWNPILLGQTSPDRSLSSTLLLEHFSTQTSSALSTL